MSSSKEIREFTLTEWDIKNATATGQLPICAIAVSAIDKFCKGCDFDRGDGCASVSLNYQARYAARKKCGYAKVNGISGIMTGEGFAASK